MKKAQLKRISEVLASLMGDTERGDLFIISNELIGFKTTNAAKLIEQYISLQPEEMPTWQNSLKDVEPVYFSQSERICHTAEDMLHKEEAIAALSKSGQTSQKNQMNFMPLFELIARQGNTSGKCYRMSENIERYYDKLVGKNVSLGLLKLAVNLLLEASDQFQNNIDTIREQLMFSMEMQFNFEGKKIDILKSEKRHVVPNIEDFFKMRKHIQMRYFDPLNWYFEIYKDDLKGIEHKLYQDIKHQKEMKLANDTFNQIIRTVRQANNVIEGNTPTPF